MRRSLLALLLVAACSLPDAYGPEPSVNLEVAPATVPVVIYRPATPGPHPVVVWLHAGGWAQGTALLSSNHAIMRLVSFGYAVASIDYRLSGAATWPAQGEDVRAGVRYLRATPLDLLTDRIGVIGYSAGGHLAAHLGARCDTLPECVQAVVAVSAPVDFTREDAQLAAKGCASPRVEVVGSQEYRLLGALPSVSPWTVDVSPLTWINGDEPPFLIFHGLQDCTVPAAQSGQLTARLSAAGVPVQRYQYAAGHPMLPLLAVDSTMARIVAFFDAHVRGGTP